MLRSGLVIALALSLGATASAAQEDGAQAAAVAGDPAFAPQGLRLVDVPKATGPAVSLLNGKDLDEWETWLGYADPALTYLPDPAKPIGFGKGRGDIFRMVQEDGGPALYINGKTWGAIVHNRDFSNYHLSLEYKWGKTRYAPRLDQPHNNGLLFHSHGKHGAVFGTWMPAVEFEIMKGSVGMVVPVGTQIGVKTEVGRDPAIIYPHRRYMPGGRLVSVAQPAWNVEAERDAEKPVGEWNKLDLYVLGDRAVHVVNGVPVMVLHDLTTTDAATGKTRPLTSGRIQFQSEGAETYFRNVTVEPIKSLPKVVRLETHALTKAGSRR